MAGCLLATVWIPGPAGRGGGAIRWSEGPHSLAGKGLWLPPMLGLPWPSADQASCNESQRVIQGREQRLSYVTYLSIIPLGNISSIFW